MGGQGAVGAKLKCRRVEVLTRKKLILDLKYEILAQTRCCLYTSPKACLNAVLVTHRPKCQTSATCKLGLNHSEFTNSETNDYCVPGKAILTAKITSGMTFVGVPTGNASKGLRSGYLL